MATKDDEATAERELRRLRRVEATARDLVIVMWEATQGDLPEEAKAVMRALEGKDDAEEEE